MRSCFIFTAALGLLAGSASAQSPDATPFNGPFLGVQGGYQLDRGSVDADLGDEPINAGQSHSGFAYGGQVGIDHRIGRQMVVGVEGSVTGDTGSKTVVVDDQGDGFKLSLGRTFDVTGRVGYLFDPRNLLYVRGGWTNGEVKARYAGESDSATRSGYVLGAGYEQLVSRHFSARLEYNYSHFSENFGSDFVQFGVRSAYLSDNRHQVTFGLNYRF